MRPMKNPLSRLGRGIAAGAALLALLLPAPPARADIAVQDDTGREVRLKAPARRIVSLAPHATENLYAAGAGERLVAAVDYSDYPEAARRLPRVGGYSRIDLEAVLALKPDLVVAWQSGNPPAQVEKLRSFGLPVFMTQPNRMEDVAGQIERLGRLAGTDAAARATAEAFRARLAALREANAGKPPVRVFYQVWKTPLTTIGGPQIISSAIRLCGGDNIFGHLEQLAPTVSLEAVLAADPEAIVASGMDESRPQWLDDWLKWPRLTAVKRGNLFHVPPELLQRHTPRLLSGAERLCAHLDEARRRRR